MVRQKIGEDVKTVKALSFWTWVPWLIMLIWPILIYW
jgi:hypothetical protein